MNEFGGTSGGRSKFWLHPNLLPFRHSCRHWLQTTSYKRDNYPQLNKCDSRIDCRLMAYH